MPSRKKAKGKARKAAKEAAKAKAKEEKSQAAVAGNNLEDESLAAQLQRLQISRGLSMSCRHGVDDTPPICNEFIAAFIPGFLAMLDGNAMDAFEAAHEATSGEKFADVYSSMQETVVSMLVAAGTDSFLGGDIGPAQLYAALACHFEELIAVSVRHTAGLVNWVKVFELLSADEHTLAKFYRKRIPCHCLDEKYKEVKSVKKLGWCYNPSCSRPDQMAVRSKMFTCARCGEVNYCSIECQKADWKAHKEYCNRIVKATAAFDSKQRV